jgi:P-type Cu+ transporter
MNPKKQKDPVCGTDIDPARCNHKTTHHQKQYNFCCQQCLDAFKKSPEKYSK